MRERTTPHQELLHVLMTKEETSHISERVVKRLSMCILHLHKLSVLRNSALSVIANCLQNFIN